MVLPCHNRHRYPPPAVAARPEAAQSRGGRSEAALSGGGRPEAALRSACSPWRTATPLRKILFALLL